MGRLTIPVGPVKVELFDDDRICRSIMAGRPFEPASLVAWSKMVVPGSEVLDVGAYSGLFAIAAAKLGARPVAIEPIPVMQDRIADNARANGVKVSLIRAAASDQTGTARIGVNDQVHLTSGASLLRKSGHGIMVKTVRLDELKVEKVSTIKIDVERYEAGVIMGALALIERCRPKLMVEVLDAHARKAVEGLLPRYRVVDLLDSRNLVMEHV